MWSADRGRRARTRRPCRPGTVRGRSGSSRRRSRRRRAGPPRSWFVGSQSRLRPLEDFRRMALTVCLIKRATAHRSDHHRCLPASRLPLDHALHPPEMIAGKSRVAHPVGSDRLREACRLGRSESAVSLRGGGDLCELFVCRTRAFGRQPVGPPKGEHHRRTSLARAPTDRFSVRWSANERCSLEVFSRGVLFKGPPFRSGLMAGS
jgi:hypothetical protein